MRLIDADELLRIIDNTELTFDGGVDVNELEYIIRNAPTINKWIPIEERLPEGNKYILISFSNDVLPGIGRYEEDKDGNGAFYYGDDEKPCSHYGIFANAWMPLPEPYEEGTK